MSELEQADGGRDGGVELAERSKLPAMAEELERLEKEARKAAQRHGTMRRWYSRVYWLIGLPAAILATAAGTSALTDRSTTLTAAIAFAAAALAAFQSLMRPDEREESHRRRAAAYDVLAGEARILRRVELETLDLRQQTDRLLEINEQFGALEGQATFIK
jgi:hypothetical protein